MRGLRDIMNVDYGRTAASGSQDQTLRYWDAQTGEPIGAPLAHGGWVLQVVPNPVGWSFGTAGNDHVGRIWEIPSHPLSVRQMLDLASKLNGANLPE